MTQEPQDLLLPEQFTEAEQQVYLRKLWALLTALAERYNGFDSTSMPVERAQALLHSLAYTLATAAQAEHLSPQALVQEDFPSLLRRGQAILDEQCRATKAAYAALCRTALPVPNEFYVRTLQNLEAFFARYDRYYAAHEIPCDIDYPLLRPVSEERKGVNYIAEYIRRLCAENDFLCRFPSGSVPVFLEACLPDVREDYINFAEAVLVQAIGRTLLSAGLDTLAISPAQRAALKQLLRESSNAARKAQLTESCVALCNTLCVEPDYFLPAVQDWSLRLGAAMDGDLSHVFLSASVL